MADDVLIDKRDNGVDDDHAEPAGEPERDGRRR